MIGTSEAISLTSPTTPNPPASLSAARGIGDATLSWTAANNGGWTVTGYEFRYREIGGEFGPWTGLGMAFTTTVSGLSDSTGYAFEVRAENGAGKGEAILTRMVIADFKLVNDNPGSVIDDNVDLMNLRKGTVVDKSRFSNDRWGIRAATVHNPSIGSMELELIGPLSHTRTEGGSPWSLFGDSGRGNIVGKDLPAGPYRLNATVYSKSGLQGTMLETRSVEFLVVEQMPFEPQNLAWGRDGADLIVSWEPPSNSERAEVTGYQYQYRIGLFGTLIGWSEPITELTVTIPDVPGVEYTTFRVRALNAGGEGKPASLTKHSGPDQPGDFAAVVADGSAILTWTEPYSDQITITRYEYRYGRVESEFGPWTDVGNGLTVTITELDDWRSYVFEVRSVNAHDHGAAAQISVVKNTIITGFTLLEDGNQSNSLDLTQGTTVVLADYGVNDFAIKVNLSDDSVVGKVDLELSGAHVQTQGRTEGRSPYSLHGDNGPDDLHGESLAIGEYTLSATVYGKASEGGAVLEWLEISFMVAADRLASPQLAVAPNTSATGAPTISGTAQVGQTLTADVTGIADADGLNNVVFAYHWVRTDGGVDTNIEDATDPTYTLTEDDEGKTIQVRVSFTDDADNQESLPSESTRPVAPDPGPLTGFTVVDTSGDSDTVLGTLEDGGTLTLEDPASQFHGIRVDTNSNDDIHKVVLALSGAKTEGKTEGVFPYSLYGTKARATLTARTCPSEITN